MVRRHCQKAIPLERTRLSVGRWGDGTVIKRPDNRHPGSWNIPLGLKAEINLRLCCRPFAVAPEEPIRWANSRNRNHAS
eukprot:1811017-Alexandrium_andersonii.AAC.2